MMKGIGEMKENKLKKYSKRFAVVFFILLAFLTYFSTTIDNMLLPRVKVTDVEVGYLNEDDGSMKTKYLLPLSSVIGFGSTGTTFAVTTDENGKSYVQEISVDICDEDDLYYEVTSNSLFSDMQVIYKTSKDIANGDRVYIEEE